MSYERQNNGTTRNDWAGTDGRQYGLAFALRWTIKAAVDEGVPGAPVLTTALYERFTSRGEATYQNKLLSAMRFGFGSHLEKAASK